MDTQPNPNQYTAPTTVEALLPLDARNLVKRIIRGDETAKHNPSRSFSMEQLDFSGNLQLVPIYRDGSTVEAKTFSSSVELATNHDPQTGITDTVRLHAVLTQGGKGESSIMHHALIAVEQRQLPDGRVQLISSPASLYP